MIGYVVALLVLSTAGLIWIYMKAPGSTGEMDDYDDRKYFD